ncbi:MAG: gephyrin-like molybdotransferase Glp, partial [Gaiellaceae bacterium]
MADLITFEEAQRLVLEHVRPLPAVSVPLAEAYGRVAAEAVPAAVDLPPFDSSAMDGFAVRAEDTPGTLPVAVHVAAGAPSPRPLEPKEAMGIATGGAVPQGADAVVPIEYVVQHDNKVEIPEAVPVGANVRSAGGDVRRG